jgi:hypothetical protein
MCTTFKIRYSICKREEYGRGPRKDQPCVDEEFAQCEKALGSGQVCPEPAVRSVWVEYKCHEHGGPTAQKREQLMRKRGKKGRERQIVVKKGDRPSRWNGAVCVVM